MLTCHFNVAAREIGIGCGLSLPPRSTTLVATYVAGGPFSKVMVDSRGVTFIKNELFLLYSQVIIKECVYGYRSSVENGQGAYSGE